jgi:hypothetical protein
MTSDQQIPDPHDHHHGDGRRPFGFWLKLVDRRLSEEMDTLFSDEGLSRRDWRLLNLLAGEANDEHLAAKLHAKPGVVHDLAERGWVEGTPPALTASGRETLDRLTERVTALRERVAGAVSAEDFATTLATLEAVARELGWDESQPMPRGHRGGRGFGRRHGFGRFGRPGEHAHGGPFDHGGPFGHAAPGDRRERCDEHHRGGEHGHGDHGRGRFGRPGHADRREHGGFGGRRGPRQDVHVHVHLHDGARRPDADA